MRILHTPLCQVRNGRANNKVTSVILTWDYQQQCIMSTKFPLRAALLCVVPYHVLGMFCQYWHLSIHTAWSNTRPGHAVAPLSSGSLCVACKSFSYTGQGSHWYRAVATEVPVTVPLHAWSGQGQLSHWTLTSDNIQSVGEGTHHHHQVTIIIIMAKKAGGRKTHMYSSHTLRASVPCRPFEQPETRVEVSNSLSECVV